jgi:hypothetical protein
LVEEEAGEMEEKEAGELEDEEDIHDMTVRSPRGYTDSTRNGRCE